jgi:DUF1009 family protein
MTWAATGVAVGVLSIGTSLYGGSQGKKAAKEAGKASAAAIMTNYREESRRAKAGFETERSLADLAIGASNIQKSGSALAYVDALAGEQSRQLDWMKKAAQANARAARKGGQVAGSSLQMQGYSQALSTAGSMAQSAAANYKPTTPTPKA